MKVKITYLIFLLLMAVMPFASLASHIRAGEITVRRLPGSTSLYEFTLVVYTDTNSPVNNPQATITFNSGLSVQVNKTSTTLIGNSTAKNVYIFQQALSGNGTFTFSYKEDLRNPGVVNIPNSNTIAFSVNTTAVIDPFLGENNSVQLLTPPIDCGYTGQPFIHIPGGFDPDGDSLYYTLQVPQQALGIPVGGYAYPNDPNLTGVGQNLPQGTFEIDHNTGVLTWDSPNIVGEYNVAILVEEFRFGVKVGSVLRDMQIIIKPGLLNFPPVVTVPRDTCVIAGAMIVDTIFADDPDGDDLNLFSYGGVYQSPFTATFATNNPSPPIHRGVFRWNPTCDDVREASYQVVFKAEDLRPDGNKSADLKQWNIKVLGPPPDSLMAVAEGLDAVRLTWLPYACQNADSIIVYRRKGTSGYVPGACDEGLPAGTGFQQIATVSVTDSTFLDNNGGAGLSVGPSYCYILVADFGPPGDGLSIPSAEACVAVPITAPVITEVSVLETGIGDGSIQVRWVPPYDYDPGSNGIFAYNVLRADDIVGTFMPVFSSDTGFQISTLDTSFIDTLLNTEERTYRYKVQLLGGDFAPIPNILLGESAVAGSVRLMTVGNSGSIALNWTADVPWINNPFFHRVYRQNGAGIFQLYDSVFVNSDAAQSYTDNGGPGFEIEAGNEYCYYVETKGSYQNDSLPSPLINLSQVSCALAIDTVAPCPPSSLILKGPDPTKGDCELISQGITPEVRLSWTRSTVPGCDSSAVSFNIYYASSSNVPLQLIDSTTDTMYVYRNSTNISGCYAITAVDEFGNESALGQKFCLENPCLYYELPNVLTPNRDGKNDLFRPFPVPRFVKSVDFRVFNRWGKEVFSVNDDIYLNWDGRNMNGDPLPAGVYFYQARVKFFGLDGGIEQDLKGWIQLFDVIGSSTE